MFWAERPYTAVQSKPIHWEFGSAPVPPMPAYLPIVPHAVELLTAAERASEARSLPAMEDALRSVRFFLEKAEAELAKAQSKTA